MKKSILFTAMIIGLFFFLGWMSFATNDGNASITIDTNKVKEDTSTAVEKSKELVEDGLDKLKSSKSEVEDPSPALETSPELEDSSGGSRALAPQP